MTSKELLEYINAKIEIDNNDKDILTNPLRYIEKCGAVNALLDIKELLVKENYEEPKGKDFLYKVEKEIQEELSYLIDNVDYELLCAIKTSVLRSIERVLKDDK